MSEKENDFNILVECGECGIISYIPESEIKGFKYCPNGDCDSTDFTFYKKIERGKK